MKAFTKELKRIVPKDINKISRHNNSKWDKMTDSQKRSHILNKKKSYFEKWKNLQSQAITKTQKEICKYMLNYIEKYTR